MERATRRDSVDIEVVEYADAESLAMGVAQQLAILVAEAQTDGRIPSLVLTGGTVAAKLHAAVPGVAKARSVGSAIDWDRVDFWFGDERYVERDSPDRNAYQARTAMLDRLRADRRIHEMPWADGEFGEDVEAAAAAYARELGPDPHFDVLMLGVGPDGHCASLFPGRPEVLSPASVLAVRDSPKLPPTRISLGLSTLGRADEVWFLVAGAEKAQTAAALIEETDPVVTPACGPRGTRRTVLFVDREAAAQLPRGS